MDAVEFLIEKNRMCRSMRDCNECELDKAHCCPTRNAKEPPEKAVEIVEQWSKEHPKKTRESEFLKNYPNASPNTLDGYPNINPCALDMTLERAALCDELFCAECRRKYWTEEVK